MGIFSSLSFSKIDLTLVLHIDVGLGEARAALLSSPEEGKIDRRMQMLFTSPSVKKTGKGEHGKSLTITLASLRHALESTEAFLKKERREGRHYRIQFAYAILGAPYYLSYTAMIKYRESKGFLVTKELVSNLLSGYRKNDDPEYQGHEEAEIGSSPLTVQERILHMKLNGYNISEPYGKRAETIELSVFRTEAALDVVNGVKREVSKLFSAPLFFEPVSLAAYVALRDHVHFKEDFLFVVVGSEITEVSLVRGYSLLETASFPFGKNSLIRHISRDLKAPEEMIEASLLGYQNKSLSKEETEKVSTSLSHGAEKWYGFFDHSLIALSGQSAVPQHLYIVTDASMSDVFKKFAAKEGFSGQSLTPAGFKVEAIDTEKAKSLMHFGPDASCDIPLCLEGLFALSTKIPVHIEV